MESGCTERRTGTHANNNNNNNSKLLLLLLDNKILYKVKWRYKKVQGQIVKYIL